ncbi:hypothetical protein ACFL5Z_09725 [Planctomycetota bacterium]
MNEKQKTVWVFLTSMTVLLLAGAWSVFVEDGWASEPWSDLSLEGIWTTTVPTPAGTSAIMSLVISAQGSEGAVYTCVGKHPECSVTAYGLSPEAESVSDLLGYLVRTGANTFQFNVVCQGIKKGGPELLNVGETLYMVVLSGNAELIDRNTMIVHEFTYAAYMSDQDADGDRLPDEGAEPVTFAAIPQLSFKRLLLFPPSEPTSMN